MRHEDDTLLAISADHLDALYDELESARADAAHQKRMYESCRMNLIVSMILDAIAAIALVVMIIWQQ